MGDGAESSGQNEIATPLADGSRLQLAVVFSRPLDLLVQKGPVQN